MKRKKRITSVISLWLLLIVSLIYLIASALMYAIQYRMEDRELLEYIEETFSEEMLNVRVYVDMELYEQALFYVDALSARILNNPESAMEEVERNFPILLDMYSVSEADLVDRSGAIVVSTDEENVGYNLREHPALSGALELFGAEDGAAAHFDGATLNNPAIARYSAAVVPETDMLLLCGVTEQDIEEILLDYASGDMEHTAWGETGFLLNATNDLVIRAATGNRFIGQTLPELGIDVREDEEYRVMVTKLRVNGTPSYVRIDNTMGYFYVGVLPVSEQMEGFFKSMLSTLALMTAVFVALYFILVRLMKIVVVNKIAAVNKSLSAIASGDLEEKVDVRDSVEFNSLSDDINATVDRLKEYIAEAAARIDKELAVAKEIQRSSLPDVGALPPNAAFSLAASMNPAKEVGGDFYDFYFLDENRLALLIADVAGKGIPGAMYMMRSKSLIKNRALQGGSLAKIISDVNETLCEGNDAGMFVTVWFAILDVSTGKGMAVNAGHEHPALRRKGGNFEMVKYRHSPAVATMEGIRFREHEFQLNPGDCLFVYTDGVAEATDATPELFGEARMLEALNRTPDAAPKELLAAVKRSIDDFVGEAEQFDDITMLCLEYFGAEGISGSSV